MPIGPDEFAEIRTLLGSDGVEAVSTLRSRFPHLSLTFCDASDVTEVPYGTEGDCDIHLVDTRGHCAQITDDPAQATGFVIARRRADA